MYVVCDICACHKPFVTMEPDFPNSHVIFPSEALVRFFFLTSTYNGLDSSAYSGKGRGHEAPDSMRDWNQMARKLSLICFVSRSTATLLQYWFGFYLVGCSPLKMTAGADQRE